MENYCLTYGKEISYKRNYCEDCVKKISKKRNLSNTDIMSKYQFARNKIKTFSENLVKKIDLELEKLSSLKEKFILNESNYKLLDNQMAKLVSFKDKLIESWQQTAKEI